MLYTVEEISRRTCAHVSLFRKFVQFIVRPDPRKLAVSSDVSFLHAGGRHESDMKMGVRDAYKRVWGSHEV